MQIRITHPPTGLFNGQPWPASGQIIDLPDHVAADLVAGRHAEPAPSDEPPVEPAPSDEPPVETATTKPPVETRPARGKRG